MRIKHRVRILVVNDSKYYIYKRVYLLYFIPYWKLMRICETSFKTALKYAEEYAQEKYPNILELKYKKK